MYTNDNQSLLDEARNTLAALLMELTPNHVSDDTFAKLVTALENLMLDHTRKTLQRLQNR